MPKLPNKLYRADQVRELDRRAIQKYNITGYELMTRAAHASYKIIKMNWHELEAIAVFCGSGNNAGDGYVLARLFMEADLSVNVYAVASPEKLQGDALLAYQSFIKIGGTVQFFTSEIDDVSNLFIDAMLGTGLDREVEGLYAEAIQLINAAYQPVIALDIPSGIHADTGHKMGFAIRAETTISFIGLKQGLFTGDAAEHSGEIYFSSLDVPDELYDEVPTHVEQVQPSSLPRRKRCANKGHYGHVLAIGGDLGFSGAVRLAAEASARLGAGLTSVATHPGHAVMLDVAMLELMCHGVANQEQLQVVMGKASVIIIGPGLGQSVWAQDLLLTTVGIDKPLVVDADALNLLAKNPLHKNNWVLTPHPGEAARLLDISTAEIQNDRFASVTAIQKKYGGVCVLKGAGTLICDDQGIAVANTGNPGMASGGMGDVLTGVIASLIAQGMDRVEAARTGAFIHGQAADMIAKENGERGMLASDLMVPLRSLVNFT